MTEPRLNLPLLTVTDLADLLALPKSTIYEHVRRGAIPHIKLGRHIRFERTTLERWLAAQLDPEKRSRP